MENNDFSIDFTVQKQNYHVNFRENSDGNVLVNGRNYKLEGPQSQIDYVESLLNKLGSSSVTIEGLKDNLVNAGAQNIAASEKTRNVALSLYQSPEETLIENTVELLSGEVSWEEFQGRTEDFNIAGAISDHNEIKDWLSTVQLLSQGYKLESYESSRGKEGEKEFDLTLKNSLTGSLQQISLVFDASNPPKLKSIGGDPVELPKVAGATLTREEIGAQLKEFVSHLAEKGAFSGAVLYAGKDKEYCRAALGEANREQGIAINDKTKFNLASVGKIFTASAINKLVYEKKLSYETTLDEALSGSRFLEKLPEEAAEKMTIKHLCTHCSGLSGNYHDKLERMDPEEIDKIESLDDFFNLVDIPKKIDVPKEIKDEEIDYCNTNFLLLGAVIENISGEDFRSFIESSVLEKMPNSGFDTLKEGSEELACGYSIEADSSEQGYHWKSNLAHHVRRGGPDGGTVSTIDDLHTFCQTYMESEEKVMPGLGKEYEKSIGLKVGHAGAFEGATNTVDMYPETGEVLIILSNFGNGRSTFIDPIINKFLELRKS